MINNLFHVVMTKLHHHVHQHIPHWGAFMEEQCSHFSKTWKRGLLGKIAVFIFGCFTLSCVTTVIGGALGSNLKATLHSGPLLQQRWRILKLRSWCLTRQPNQQLQRLTTHFNSTPTTTPVPATKPIPRRRVHRHPVQHPSQLNCPPLLQQKWNL